MILSKVRSLVTFLLSKSKAWRYKKIYRQYRHYTMISEYLYCQNLKLIDQHLNATPGDVVECGVWRGGMTAGITAIGGKNRHYHLFDSFEGLPQAKAIDGLSALAWQKDVDSPNYYDNCSAEIGYAEEVMKMTRAPYTLHKGWFNNTLTDFTPENPVALLRLDADWYDSTIDCLTQLYPKVCKNGLIILDDYYTWDGCSRAVHDYLAGIKSASRIASYNGICYIIKKEE